MMLSLDTAYRSFGGEVEASSTPTICRLSDSRRHQLWAIAHEVHSVRERFESVVAQLCRLLIKVLSAPQRTIPPIDRHSPSSRPTLPSASRYSARLVSSSAVRRAYQLCLFSPHWRVGWRFVDDGGVWKSHTLAGAPWNDIADPGFRFYADPFPYTFGGKTFVFVEEFDHHEGKGTIAAIPFDEKGQTGPAISVLSEP